MYEIGQLIIYGGEGVCRVEDIVPSPIPGVGQDKPYYKLSPYYHKGVIYAPTDVNVPMRPVLTAQEARQLIKRIPQVDAAAEMPPPSKQAAQEYKALLQTYDDMNLIRIIRMIYRKNRQAIAQGKGYGHVDERFFKRAKELLHGELAISLGIPVEQVEAAIGAILEEEAQLRPVAGD